MEQKTLQAAWVIPVAGPPIKDAAIIIAGDRIKAIGQKSDFLTDETTIDYGQAIIVPGFINLHTHLEFTNLTDLSAEGGLFCWLSRLMAATANWSSADRQHSVEQGIKEIIASGTTFVVDNSYAGASIKALAQSGLRSLIGLELFGVDQLLTETLWSKWQQRLAELLLENVVIVAQKEKRLDITVAPHAPYTVCPALWRKAQQWSSTNNKLLLTHLAETEAERNWFTDTDGDLTQFLIRAFGRLDTNFVNEYAQKTAWKKGSDSSVKHLYNHDLLQKNILAAHAVHISDEDIALLKAQAVSIAHCPRSNARLACGRAPLAKMAGLKIGIGTDSKASNDDLDIRAEAKFAADWHEKPIDCKQLLEHLTIKAAACLGRDQELGSVEPGRLADLAVFAMPSKPVCEDPYALLFQKQTPLKALFVGGCEIGGFQGTQ